MEKLTSINALTSTSVKFSFWNIVKNCKKASIGTTCLRDVSTPAEFLKMEAAAKALYTFLFSFRVLKSVKSVELFRVREPKYISKKLYEKHYFHKIKEMHKTFFTINPPDFLHIFCSFPTSSIVSTFDLMTFYRKKVIFW